MRIISGLHKGKRLVAPKKLPVRPTTDMAKEGLFNILNNQYYFDQLSVIDLFAGTGNISFEFASRGTQHITSVDSHFACLQYINKISDELDFNISTVKSDVFKYLDKVSSTSDLIFADPPYNLSAELFAKIPALVFSNSLLKEDGILIIEHAKQTKLSALPNFSHEKRYGGSTFSFFKAQ
jgi:16S rRNA (guanine(966)-N(2))-methyltransferase RsmD